jgi:hypothetical protein
MMVKPANTNAPVAEDPLDPLVVRMLYELHSHVPEEQRPMSMSDLSDEQAERARRAVLAILGPAAKLIHRTPSTDEEDRK